LPEELPLFITSSVPSASMVAFIKVSVTIVIDAV